MPDIYTFNTDTPIFRERISVNNKIYVLDFEWNTRLSDWRVTVLPSDGGEAVVADRRVCNGSMIGLGTDGVICFVGSDPYDQRAFIDKQIYMEVATSAEIDAYRAAQPSGTLPDLTYV